MVRFLTNVLSGVCDKWIDFLFTICKVGFVFTLLFFVGLLVYKKFNEPESPEKIARMQEYAQLTEGKSVLVRDEQGIKVWKFLDKNSGHFVYFTSRGDVSWEENCGKGCKRTVTNTKE